MLMDHQIREGIDCNILGCVYIVHKAINKENKSAKQFFHDVSKGTFITIKETAVVTCAVVHIGSSLGRVRPFNDYTIEKWGIPYIFFIIA